MDDITQTLKKYKGNTYCFEIIKRINSQYPNMRFFADTSVLYNPGDKLGVFYIGDADDAKIQELLQEIEEIHPAVKRAMKSIYFTKLTEEPGIALPNLFEITSNL